MTRSTAIILALVLSFGCDRPERPAAPAAAPAQAATPSPPAEPPAIPSASATASLPGTGPSQPLPPERLCVTSGSISPRGLTRFSVDAPTFRAVTPTACDPRAELRFTYVGPTATTRALGSGAVRQQIGLKLRAQDPCNLVYVMWRIEPEQKLVVSIKENAGQRTSRECGNRGYRNVKPRATGPLPAIAAGSSHVLRAEMNGDALQVLADGASVWEGALGPEVLALNGPVGVRTDNVQIEAELVGPTGGAPRACGAGDDGE